MASTRSSVLSLPRRLTLPASIGPPDTNTEGMSRRSEAISMPGVILSQLEMQTRPSTQWRRCRRLDSPVRSRGREAVEHAVMTHGDAVVHRDGVEFLGDAARLLDLPRHELAEILEVHVAGHELGERVDDRIGLPKSVLHTRRAPRPRAPAMLRPRTCVGTILGHGTGLEKRVTSDVPKHS